MKNMVWITNLPAPYRKPIWEELGKKFKLDVYFLLGIENWRNWRIVPSENFSQSFLNFKVFRFGEFEFIPQISIRTISFKNAEFLVLGSWEAPMYLYMMMLAKIKKVKVIVFHESTTESQKFNNFVKRLVKRRFYTSADLIVTFGFESTKVLTNLGITPEKILELFNPIAPRSSIISTKSRRGHHYLYVGQLITRKNILAIVDAFSQIKTKFDTLTIAGTGPDQSLIMDYVRRLDLPDSVLFSGHLSSSELELLYSQSNTLILASHVEVWGLVVNEALSSGMHVVVSKNCGVSDLIKSMKGVYIVQKDSLSISKGMKKSRNDWTGRIRLPEISNYSTSDFSRRIYSEIASRFLNSSKNQIGK